MLGQLIIASAAFIVGLLVIVVAVLLAVRARVPAAVDVLRRFSRLFNPLQRRTAGTRGSSTSLVRHVGRKSGRAYATPVDAVATDDGFLIALPYGTQSQWVRNVMAQGAATIVDDGHAYPVDRPEIIPLEGVATRFSASDQRGLRLFRVEQCLRVRRVAGAA